jgi:hypothetical protein
LHFSRDRRWHLSIGSAALRFFVSALAAVLDRFSGGPAALLRTTAEQVRHLEGARRELRLRLSE